MGIIIKDTTSTPMKDLAPGGMSRLSDHMDRIEEGGYAGTRLSYGIQLSWRSPGDEKSMYYDIDMACVGAKSEHTIWEINKTNYFIDNERPEGPMEQLAIACMQPCYPLEFAVTNDGQIDKVSNAGKIQRRFIEALSDLQRDFGGDLAAEYIQETQLCLSEHEQLNKLVTSDIWLSLFFAPVNDILSSATKAIAVNIPVFAFEEPLRFKGEVMFGKKDSERRSQTILVNGVLDNPPDANGRNLLSGKMEAIYDIDIHGHQVRNIACHAMVDTDEGEHHVWLKGYRIAAAQLQAPPAPPEEEKPEPKSYWASIFGS